MGVKKKSSKSEWPKIISASGITVKVYLSPQKTKGGMVDSYIVAYYLHAERVRERITDWDTAWKHAQNKHAELVSGSAQVGNFSVRETHTINTAVELLEPLDIPLSEAARKVAEAEKLLQGKGTIEEAVQLLLAQKKKADLPTVAFGEIVDGFLNSMRDPVTGKQLRLSYRYWQDCSGRLGAARELFRSIPIGDVSTRDLENLLDRLPKRVRTAKGVIMKAEKRKITGDNRNKYRAVFCTLFGYARSLGYLTRGIPTEAEHMLLSSDPKPTSEEASQEEEDIYTPKEMQQILDKMEKRWIPYAAIGTFAGIRSAELHRLDWRDIDLEERIITVGKWKSKVGSRRIIRISDQLAAWLAPFDQESGWICPHYSHDSTLSIEFKKAFVKTGVRKIHNGFRNSHASYRLAEVGETAGIAWEMNTSERKLKDNYLELVSPRQLLAWKKVLPKIELVPSTP